jgi:hypothetical protein
LLDKDIEVKLSEEILAEYESVRTPWAAESKADEDFALGHQWTAKQIAELKRRRQSPVIVNVIYPAVDQAVALLTSNKPRFSSTGREDSDVKIGKMFSEIMSYVWETSDANTELKQTIFDAYVKSQGYLYAYIDPYGDFGKGEVRITSIDPYDVFVDPNSKDRYFKDAAHIIIAKIITEDKAKSMYPDVDLSQAQECDSSRHPSSTRNLQDGINMVSKNIHKHYELLDRHSKHKVLFAHIYDPNSNLEKILNEEELKEFLEQEAFVRITEGQPPEFITREEKVAETAQLFEQTGGVYYFIQNPETGESIMQPGEPDPNNPYVIEGSRTELQRMIMAQLVTEGIIGLRQVYQDRVYRCLSLGGVKIWGGYLADVDEYPIGRLTFDFIRSPYPKSEISKVRGLQESINKIRSLILAHAASTANLKVLLPRGSMDKKQFEAEFGKSGTAVLEVDMELGGPQIVVPPPLPNELYKSEADMRHDIQEILGIYALMQGDSGQAPPTYKGTVALDEYGQRRIKSKKDDVEGMLNHLAKVIVQLIQMTYTEHKVIRMLRPNNIEQTTEINQPLYDDVTRSIVGKLNDITVGKYDIIVVSGSMLPSNRWAQLEYYVELYQKGIIDQVEVLKKTEVVDMEGVLERHSQITQMGRYIEDLEGQVKKLEGDLQTADRESVAARKRTEVAKFSADLEKLKSKADAGTQLYNHRLNDELRINKLENKGMKK